MGHYHFGPDVLTEESVAFGSDALANGVVE